MKRPGVHRRKAQGWIRNSYPCLGMSRTLASMRFCIWICLALHFDRSRIDPSVGRPCLVVSPVGLAHWVTVGALLLLFWCFRQHFCVENSCRKRQSTLPRIRARAYDVWVRRGRKGKSKWMQGRPLKNECIVKKQQQFLPYTIVTKGLFLARHRPTVCKTQTDLPEWIGSEPAE